MVKNWMLKLAMGRTNDKKWVWLIIVSNFSFYFLYTVPNRLKEWMKIVILYCVQCTYYICNMISTNHPRSSIWYALCTMPNMDSVEKQSMIQLSHHLSQEVWYYFDRIWSIIITSLVTCCFSIEFQWNNIFSNWLLLYFVRIKVELSSDYDPVFKIMLLKSSAFGLYTKL